MRRMGKLPFRIDRNDPRTLVRQVTDGLRHAIVTGVYAPGEALPSSRDLGSLLGVSRIVTSAALAKLAEEGFASSRPRIGCVVRDRREKRWSGRVLVVCPDGDDNFFQNFLVGVLRSRLAAIGYLFSVATVPMGGDGHYDFANLDAALSVTVDFALVIYAREEIFRALARRGIAYAVFGEVAKPPKGCVGLVRFDYDMAVPDFVAACRRAGAGKVVQVGWHPLMCDAVPALRKAGIAATRVMLKPDLSRGRVVGAQRAGMDFFLRQLKRGGLDGGTVYFLNDDNLTRGALAALAFHRLRIPEDVRVVTWANREWGPIYPRPFARMEMDEVGAGAALAETVTAYLKSGEFPRGRAIGPRWIDGMSICQHGK